MPEAAAPIDVQRFDSELGEWLLATWAPPALAGVVEVMWYFEGRMAHARERVFPRGSLELILQLDEPYSEVRGDELERYPHFCVTGQQLRPSVIEAPHGRRTTVLGVKFTPPGAFAVFGAPLDGMTDLTIDLRDVAADVQTLEAACSAPAGCRARLRSAAAWLMRAAARGPSVDAAVAWAADAIVRAHGSVSISAIQEQTGWSKTRFTRLFREQVGVTPKQLARVARFRRSLSMLDEDEDLSAVALACGYYDQPHLNAEFRALAGCTPAAYRTAARYPDSPSLAED